MLSAVEVHSLCSELEVLLTLHPKSRECRRGEFKVVARGANSRTLSVRTLSRRRPRSLLLRFSTSAPSCIAPGTDLGVHGGALPVNSFFTSAVFTFLVVNILLLTSSRTTIGKPAAVALFSSPNVGLVPVVRAGSHESFDAGYCLAARTQVPATAVEFQQWNFCHCNLYLRLVL